MLALGIANIELEWVPGDNNDMPSMGDVAADTYDTDDDTVNGRIANDEGDGSDGWFSHLLEAGSTNALLLRTVTLNEGLESF